MYAVSYALSGKRVEDGVIETIDLPERIREVAFAHLLAGQLLDLAAAADEGRQRLAGFARATRRLEQAQ